MSTQSTDDRLMACRDCGDNFIWTAGEQAYYQKQGFQEPRRCKACRQAKKARHGERGQRGSNR